MKHRQHLALLVALLCAVCVLPFGCKKKDAENGVIRVSEVAHSVFYAPFYIAVNKGFFTEEGITVELENANGSDKVMTALTSKSADIGLIGPEALVYVSRAGIKDAPVMFAQLTQRDGSFLVGRNPEPDFRWENLAGKRVLAGRKGGVPAMTLQYVANNHGLFDGQNINLDTSVAFADMGPVFAADNSVDYTTLFEPAASELVAAGKGHIVASVGAESGEVPYTGFAAKVSFLEANSALVNAFLRALLKGYGFMTTADGTSVAEALAPSFNGSPVSSLKAALDAYLAVDAWTHTPVMKESAFDRLQDIMVNAGELAGKVPFADITTNVYAQRV
jgi:NitT/TauT family transport system substrate-binding protein